MGFPTSHIWPVTNRRNDIMANPNQSNAKSLAELRAQRKRAEQRQKAKERADGAKVRAEVNKAKKKKGKK